ncbi:AbrB/MazE/SpoVT family DNA-binding domain-containing protein [Bacillus sp. BRMEA1]|uniref:AbrB/MazE/SpoVT family DNA-binding domain-containing protein n=1 Tax=Neobacillus endophyticus TaxID=2738405 RepID=UPI00156735D2|nr:AbrB/MazE/SpoVT family DNA-binding domain-containing protein [Neobacillus endophyticus]NRD77041.1 AbrB/MazE/SpoVT family DNA-binding domain-containing protein [Neobacillus endophyticus]
MKSTGFVRKLDELGRFVIPIELRKTLSIREKDQVEVFIDEDQIILRKNNAELACALTGEITKENKALAGGKLVLSPEGAEMLVKEIEAHFLNKVPK